MNNITRILTTLALSLSVLAGARALAGQLPQPVHSGAKNLSITLYNFYAHKKTTVSDPRKMSADLGAHLLPQSENVQALYHAYLKKGQIPFEALANTYADLLQAYKKAGLISTGSKPSASASGANH